MTPAPPDIPDIARGAIKSTIVWLAAEDIITRLGLRDASQFQYRFESEHWGFEGFINEIG